MSTYYIIAGAIPLTADNTNIKADSTLYAADATHIGQSGSYAITGLDPYLKRLNLWEEIEEDSPITVSLTADSNIVSSIEADSFITTGIVQNSYLF